MVLISAFASAFPGGVASSVLRLKICAIAAGVKKYNLVIKKKKKRHDKVLLLAVTKLNIIKVSISKALIDSYISPGEFVLVNNVLTEYNEMKEEIKNSENVV